MTAIRPLRVKDSWEKVNRKCLNGVWKNVCPQFVHDFTGFDIASTVSKSYRECLAKAIEAGFDDLEKNDIDELLDSHTVELTNEELLENEKEQEAKSQSTSETPESRKN
ncbi:hypothetical protein Pmani_017593 [Petrolisthes manimaculis]|uniref:Uncharacterized protein n=1 Tax=Petrolisthes manimaculis TaxID=1843537 RepID=A0AAE1PPT1_9EUCA|nr:hypothetical protein Pmani_017593 [Petrolisthes manimaculis]